MEYEYKIKAYERNQIELYSVWGDADSRTVIFNIIEKSGVISAVSNAQVTDLMLDLTGYTAKLRVAGSTVQTAGTITDAQNGQVQFTLTEDFCKPAGEYQCEIILTKNSEKLYVIGIKLKVDYPVSVGKRVTDENANAAYISKFVSDWMNENINSAGNVIIDSSLSVSGAAAEAKKTGSLIHGLINRQDAAFNSIPILWKNGKSLDRAKEVDQANRCISDYIEISGRNIEVIVPDDHSVKYSFLFFDSEKQYVRGTNYANESGTFNSYLNGSYCKYCRIRAGMNDDSVPSDYSDLTNNIVIVWSDSDVMKYRGNILAEGYTSFAQCTQSGYYSFTQSDLPGITDAGSFDKGGILLVERNAAARVVFQTVLLTDGTRYFRYGSNSFRKCIPDAAELPNSFAYRGEVSNYSVTALSQLTEDGYYDVKWSDRNNLSDYPADLNTSGYLVVYSNTATGRISQELHAISGIIYFRYDNNPFVRIYDPDACEQYRGNIQSLGYTAIRSCTQPGYYSCTQGYLENLTDKPTDLSTGFIVEVHNNASGGVIYQTITDNNGEQWFRHSGNPFVKRNSNGYEKPVWYAIGDSITQGFYSYMNGDTPAISTTTNCWAKIAADKAGFSLTNYGVGGSGFVHNATVGDKLNARDHIETIDFSGADMVTIAFGINDWKGSDTFGSFNDDITTGGTVYSNMRYVIEKILTDNPECKVFIITPINASKYGNQSGNWSLSHTINGKTLEDMFQLEKTVADYYGIELIDMTHSSVFNRINCPALLIDGVHPTLKGHQLMGAELAQKINFKGGTI